jgi:hypothetical protein
MRERTEEKQTVEPKKDEILDVKLEGICTYTLRCTCLPGKSLREVASGNRPCMYNESQPLHSTPPLPMSFPLSQTLEPESAQKVPIPRLSKQHVTQKDRVDKGRYGTSGIPTSIHPCPLLQHVF